MRMGLAALTKTWISIPIYPNKKATDAQSPEIADYDLYVYCTYSR